MELIVLEEFEDDICIIVINDIVGEMIVDCIFCLRVENVNL